MSRHSKERVRLVMVVNSTIDKHGSFEDFLLGSLAEARRRNWSITYVFPDIRTTSIEKSLRDGGATVKIVRAQWDSYAGAFALIAAIRSTNPDIINFHFCGSIYYIPVFSFFYLSRHKVIFHYHGEIRPLESLSSRNRHLSILRLASFFWTGAVAVSEANRRFLEVLHVAAPVTVVYNGIDPDRFLPPEASPERQSPDARSGFGFRLCYIGSLIPRKRVDVLLRAFALVLKRVQDVHLTIIGGGYLAESHQNLAATLNLEKNVTFTGTLEEYPLDLLKTSDLLVSASMSESFGLVFCEAMLLGVPVVGCRVGGIPEVVCEGVTGLLVPPDNPEMFASAVIQVLTDGELRMCLRANGPRWVRDKFALNDKVESLFTLFSRTLQLPG